MIFRDNSAPAGRWIALGVLLITITGCGGGGSGGGGDTGGSGMSPPPPADTIFTYDVPLTASAVTSGSTEPGTGSADLRYNQTRGELEGTVTLDAVTADSVAIHTGHAGDDGPIVFSLAAGTTAGSWGLDATPVPAGDVSALESGAMYVLASVNGNEEGILRGQILPAGVSVEQIALDAAQVATGSASAGAGRAWVTLDENAGNVTVHARTTGLTDANGATIREALAGDVGPMVATLAADPDDAAHWLLDSADYTNAMRSAAEAGELYLEVTTESSPDGAIRGQILPTDVELVATDLDSDAVVMSTMTAAAEAPSGRVMTTLRAEALYSNANLYGIADADAVELRQAPAGQNGPVLTSYEQDPDNPSRWSLAIETLTPTLAAGLDNQSVYVSVRTSASPQGVARGQLVTDASQTPADVSAFIVISTDPMNAAEVEALPADVTFTLNREPLPASVDTASIEVIASGGDGSFGDGNETPITPGSVTVDGNSVLVSLAGVQAGNDVYRVTLKGGGASGIVDTNGIALDGDANGTPGGNFETAFEVAQQPARLSAIQETIFTPSCATSGCHAGANPPDGLLLTAGDAYTNIVNVASVQMPSLSRVEPGNPDDSYLVRKIRGAGIVAGRMPLGRPSLSSEEIDLIVRWVTEGAADN